MVGFRRTAALVTRGAISLSSSSHFPLMLYSKLINPVAFPPGRAKLATKPPPTGSVTCTNTMGTRRVACSNDLMTVVPWARTTSGSSSTNSAAYLRMRSASAAPQRVSIRTLRPAVQPNRCRLCRNAEFFACASGSSAAKFKRTPMRRTPLGCCASAENGTQRRFLPCSNAGAI
jgi:hypothetical protein